MIIDGAVIQEQGVSFAIVVVNHDTLADHSIARDVQASYGPLFPGLPIVLMGLDANNIPRYFGRDDIVKFLVTVDPNRIPWRRYTFDQK